MEKIIVWLMGNKSSDPLIRFGRLALIFFAIAGTVATFSKGNLPRLIFLAIFVLAFAIAIWGAAEIMKSRKRYVVFFGHLLSGAMLISITTLFVCTVSFLLSGKPVVLGRMLGASVEIEVEKVAASLDSPSLEIRLAAISRLQNAEFDNEGATESMVRILESFVIRRATARNALLAQSQTRDIESAVEVLAKILRSAKEKSFKIKPLEFGAVDLSSLNLSNLYFPGASFYSTNFDDAVLDGADFSNATFIDVRMSRVFAKNIVMRQARIQNTCAEESNFSGGDLSEAMILSSDFNGASLKTANLSGASFANTRLAQVRFDGANLTRTDLATATDLEAAQMQISKQQSSSSLRPPTYIKSRLSICKQS